MINPLATEGERHRGRVKVAPHYLPSLGVCWLAAVLRERNHEVEIIDAEAPEESLLEAVDKSKPDYIGITCTILTVFRVARYIKVFKKIFPGTKIVLGGPQITASPKETIELCPEIDAGVLGEGEITIIELIEALEKGAGLDKVKGLIFRENGNLKKTEPRDFIQNLDDLPLPAWDLLPPLAETYRTSAITYKRLPAINLVTSRGCPYNCIFCDRSVFGRRWRFFSPQYILKMVKELIEKYGIKDIYFDDDQFMVSKTRIREFCNLLIENKIDLTWSAIGRIDSVDKETVFLMKEAGCHQLEFGFESGSQKILDTIKKDIQIEKAEESIRILQELGMGIKGLFMVGCPGETEETLKETEDFIKRMEITRLSVGPFTPLPGSEIYKTAHQYGRFDNDWHKINMRTPIFIPRGLSPEILNKFIGIYERR